MATDLLGRRRRTEGQRTTLDLVGEQILEGLSNLATQAQERIAQVTQATPIGRAGRMAGRASVEIPELISALSEPITERRPEGGLETVRRLIPLIAGEQPPAAPAARGGITKPDKLPSETDDKLIGVRTSISKEKKKQGELLGEQVIADQGLDNADRLATEAGQSLDVTARRNIEQAQRAENLINVGVEDPTGSQRILAGLTNIGLRLLSQRAAPPATLQDVQAIAAPEVSALGLEKFKQDRKDQREVLKSQLDLLNVSDDEKEKLVTQQVFAQDFQDLIAASFDVPLGGPLTNILGAPLGVVGIGERQRSKLRSIGELFVPRMSEFLRKEVGRGLTLPEQEIIKRESLKGFNPGAKRSTRLGGIDAIIDKTNSVLASGGSTFRLPDAETLIDQATGRQPAVLPPVQQPTTTVGTAFTGTTASGIKFTVEE